MNWSVCVDAGEADGIDAALGVRVLAVIVVEASANVDVAEKMDLKEKIEEWQRKKGPRPEYRRDPL